MTPQEVYDYITKHMTPEEALMKLLEGSLRTYENLKLGEEEKVHPLIIITMAAADMGWDIAIPPTEDDADIPGLVVGTKEYVGYTTSAL